MTENNQNNKPKKQNWAPYILVIIFIAIVIVVGMNFLGPTMGDWGPYFNPCYSMSQNEYEESKEAINDLIAGEVPDTTSLIHIFLIEGPPRYFGVKFKSLAAEEETGDFCNNHTRNVYLLLKAAYEYALEDKISTARDYLEEAEFVWICPRCYSLTQEGRNSTVPDFQTQSEIPWKLPFGLIILGTILVIFGIGFFYQRKE